MPLLLDIHLNSIVTQCASLPCMPKVALFHLTCPSCLTPRQATTAFCVHTPNKPVWCNPCNRGHACRLWTCTCNQLWLQCPLHSALTPPDKITRPYNATTTKQSNTTYLNKQRRLATEPNPTTGLPSRLLVSPGLAAKFHLQQTGSGVTRGLPANTHHN